MLARIVRDSETHNLTWQRITGDAGAAGATPLGSVLAYFGTTVPEGFLPCNGAAYDVTQYPELYTFLNSSTLPDLRECALVGIGENSTDTLGTHDIFTLGQFKDSGTYGTNTTSWEALNPYDATNNVMTTVINTTGAEQIVTAKTGTSTATLGMRTRSKGVNWIIKAIPGMETTDVTDAIKAINEKLAKALVTKDVLTLPTGASIEGYLYHYQGHYYVPHIDEESPTQSYLTELANLSDIQPVIEWLASTDPLPTGSAIKEHLYAQEYTTAGGDTKYHYYIGKVDSSDPLNNELVALETGAGASIFVGTQAEWDALSTAEKNEYKQANLTDVNSVVHVPVDVIADGNMNPVTSNAVYDALNDTPIEITPTLESGFTSGTFNKVYVFNKSKKLVLKIGCAKNSGDLVTERFCSFPAPSWLDTKSWGYYIPVAIRNTGSGSITTAVLSFHIVDGNGILGIEGPSSGYQEIRAFGSIVQSI